MSEENTALVKGASDTDKAMVQQHPDKPEPKAIMKHYSNTTVSTLKLNRDEQDKLLAKFNEDEIQIRPDGLIFLPEIFYRQRLNETFGAGAWGLAKGNIAIKDNVVMYEGALFVRGNFVAEAIGEQEYFPSNPQTTYATAVESAKSNCLMRCCKDLGINMDCWNPNFVQAWIKKNCVKVWRFSKTKNKTYVGWRKKDAEPFFDETGLVAQKDQAKEQTKEQPKNVVENIDYEVVPSAITPEELESRTHKPKTKTKQQPGESTVANELKDLGVNLDNDKPTEEVKPKSGDALVFRAGEIIDGLDSVKDIQDYATETRKSKELTPDQKLKIVDKCNHRIRDLKSLTNR